MDFRRPAGNGDGASCEAIQQLGQTGAGELPLEGSGQLLTTALESEDGRGDAASDSASAGVSRLRCRIET